MQLQFIQSELLIISIVECKGMLENALIEDLVDKNLSITTLNNDVR